MYSFLPIRAKTFIDNIECLYIHIEILYMNLQQLEYIIALDKYRHFVTAAENTFVTQATLSMMVKKLEEELGVVLFDRSKHPIIPTEAGKMVIDQAKVILRESQRLKEQILESKEIISGELRLGIIPTLAPYILPLFLNNFLKKYPDVRLQVSEITTDSIINKLEDSELDAGLLAIPVNRRNLYEQSLFYEEFVVYASTGEKFKNKKYVLAKDIDVNRLWLLEEGHCLRSQVINLCELKELEKNTHHLNFTTGSIETLKKIVEANQGITILPKLAMKDLSKSQLKNVHLFKDPAPGREIGIVTHRLHIKSKLISLLKKEILSNLPSM